MLAERLKLFATLTYRRAVSGVRRSLRQRLGAAVSTAVLGLFMLGTAHLFAPTPAMAAGLQCGDPRDMAQKGVTAFAEGRYELAMPTLDCVVRSNDALSKLHAEYYLARIFSDDAGGYVDHAKAYTLYFGIAEAADTVDPEDPRRAVFVAKSVTAIAGYVRRGLPEIGLKADLPRAVELYRNAATFFNEPDAQFELAKFHLTGTGVPVDVGVGMHYIQKLVQDGHAGAQAYLAEQHWRGTFAPQVAKDHARALAMIKIALENAGASDRLWIEDSYHNIYCGTSPQERSRAVEILAALRRSVPAQSQPSAQPPPMALGRRQPSPSRTCSNGEPIVMELRTEVAAPPLASSLTQAPPRKTTPAGMQQSTR